MVPNIPKPEESPLGVIVMNGGWREAENGISAMFETLRM
jgi:hypothetical protein